MCSHCEQLVETLSQASEELRAREGGRSTSALSLNIDDIEVYEVSEGSEAEVEVRITVLRNHNSESLYTILSSFGSVIVCLVSEWLCKIVLN